MIDEGFETLGDCSQNLDVEMLMSKHRSHPTNPTI